MKPNLVIGLIIAAALCGLLVTAVIPTPQPVIASPQPVDHNAELLRSFERLQSSFESLNQEYREIKSEVRESSESVKRLEGKVSQLQRPAPVTPRPNIQPIQAPLVNLVRAEPPAVTPMISPTAGGSLQFVSLPFRGSCGPGSACSTQQVWQTQAKQQASLGPVQRFVENRREARRARRGR